MITSVCKFAEELHAIRSRYQFQHLANLEILRSIVLMIGRNQRPIITMSATQLQCFYNILRDIICSLRIELNQKIRHFLCKEVVPGVFLLFLFSLSCFYLSERNCDGLDRFSQNILSMNHFFEGVFELLKSEIRHDVVEGAA